MRKFGCAALFAASFIAAPAASAGDYFINGQLGQIQLEDSDFDDEQSNLLQAGGGYRWGLGMAQVGLEVGVGKLDELNDSTRNDYPGGFIDRSYSLSSPPEAGTHASSARISDSTPARKSSSGSSGRASRLAERWKRRAFCSGQ